MTTQKKNYLTQSQLFQLINFLKDNLQGIMNKRDTEVAEMATKALGFLVSQQRIQRIRTDNEMPFSWSNKPLPEKSQAERDIEVLVNQIALLMEYAGTAGYRTDCTDEFLELCERARNP